jgi:HK97 family phage prohead protease
VERRFLSAATCPVKIEKRDGNQDILTGYAAVFYQPDDPGTEFQLYSDCKERIMPTAFDRAIREAQDVRCLFNHDPNQILGRSSAGTMKCSVDRRGFVYETVAGDTSIARDVCQHITRGDVTGSSFSFRVVKQMFASEGDMDIREVHDVDVYDAGPVTFPAYDSTTAGMRCQAPEEVRSAYLAWKTEQRGAVPYAAGPLLDADSWDADAALGRLRAWAGGKDSMDWAKYRKAFAWYDPDKADSLGGYKFPHHDVKDGKLMVHKKGVVAAMGACLGARGGSSLPEADRKKVYGHLAKHYKAMDMDAPEFHSGNAIVVARSVVMTRARTIELESAPL